MRTKRLAAVLILATLSFTACSKRPRVAVAPPPMPAAPAPVRALDQADRAFNETRYEEAAQAYENYLRLAPSGGQRDHALFRLALTYVLRPTPDWPNATSILRQFGQDHPNSPLKPAANLILSLRAEVDQTAADAKQRDQRIRQLTTELERLKKIDADRRRRP